MLVAVVLQELHHRHVVGEGGRGGDDLVIIGRDGNHLLEGGVEVTGSLKVMKGKYQGGARAQFLDLRGLTLRSCLQLDVDDLAAGVGGLLQELDLGGDRTGETSPVQLAATSSDHRYVGVKLEKLPDLRQRESRLREVV